MPLPTKRLLFAILLASCTPSHFEPGGRADPGVGYRVDDLTGWSGDGAQRVTANLHGVAVAVEVQGRDARLVVTAENPTRTPRTLRIGPQVEANRGDALGELRRQNLDGRPIEGGSAYLPFLPMQDLEITPGTRLVLYINTPAGHEPEVGEYLVLLLEVEAAGLRRERRLLPLVASRPAVRRRR